MLLLYFVALLHVLESLVQRVNVVWPIEYSRADANTAAVGRSKRLMSQRGTMISCANANTFLREVLPDFFRRDTRAVKHERRPGVFRQINVISI